MQKTKNYYGMIPKTIDGSDIRHTVKKIDLMPNIYINI